MPLGQKWPRPGVTKFTWAYVGKTLKTLFLSETILPRALIFGMYHHLVNLYQVCSRYPWGQKCPAPGATCFTKAYIRKNMDQIFFSETIWHRALIFSMQHHLVDLYQVCLNYGLAAKKCPRPGVTCFTYSYNKRNVKKSCCLISQGLQP